jgi:hypothetical protein
MIRLFLLMVVLLLPGCLVRGVSPVDDLSTDCRATLEALPSVASVSRHVTSEPIVRRVIQIDDWHYVRLEPFAADLQESNPSISFEDIDFAHEDHIADVRAVQAEQLEVLRALTKLGVKEVFVERLMVEDMPLLPHLLTSADSALALGAAGELHRTGELEILAAETLATHRAANPIEDGTVDPSKATSNERNADIAGQLSTREPLAVIVLGAAHDLRDALPLQTEYIRVRTKRVAELMR